MSAVVIGGGLSGLCTAYYLRKSSKLSSKLSSITVLEQSKRLGGWIETSWVNDCIRVEHGPRTIRPKGADDPMLKMIADLGLKDRVLSVSRSHASAKNRMIKVNNQLHSLPSSLRHLFLPQSPFKYPLISALAKDLVASRRKGTENNDDDDENLVDFTKRRFGSDVADFIIDPMVRGICAGDANNISADAFVLGPIFDLERRHRSVVLGALKDSFKTNKKDTSDEDDHNNNELIERSKSENWSVWSLDNGLESLVRTLSSRLSSEMDVDIRLKTRVHSVLNDDKGLMRVESVDTEKLEQQAMSNVDHVFLTLPSCHLSHIDMGWELNRMLRPLLNSIPFVTVAVINVVYNADKRVILPSAFGYLVPSNQGGAVLGVIFDSVTFDLEHTSLTLMLGGAVFDDFFGIDDEDKMVEVALKELRNTLNINVDPDHVVVRVQRDCIAQYVVGHRRRVREIRDKLDGSRVSVVGSSYDGVGLNDVVASAKKQVLKFEKMDFSSH